MIETFLNQTVIPFLRDYGLAIYLAGIVPACILDGWHNARYSHRATLPAIFTGLGWPLLFVILCVVVPLVYAVGGLFQLPSMFGTWLFRRSRMKPKPVKYLEGPPG